VHPEIAAALSTLGTKVKDRAACDDAVITLAFSMEKSTIAFTAFDYSHYLPASLLDYQLSEGEQKEIVISLLELFESGRFVETGAFWAIGKALPRLIVAHLGPYLELHWQDLNASLLRQALIALANGIYGDDNSAQEIAEMVRRENLRECLSEIRQRDFAPDSGIIEATESILNSIENLNGV